MEVTPEHKHILTESSIFTHRPVDAIFFAVPHRGSLSSSWIGRLASLCGATRRLG
jgi:hypothetical protein